MACMWFDDARRASSAAERPPGGFRAAFDARRGRGFEGSFLLKRLVGSSGGSWAMPCSLSFSLRPSLSSLTLTKAANWGPRGSLPRSSIFAMSAAICSSRPPARSRSKASALAARSMSAFARSAAARGPAAAPSP